MALTCEYSPVTDFREARCRQFDEGECSRGGYCNFMHIREPSRDLRKNLEKEYGFMGGKMKGTGSMASLKGGGEGMIGAITMTEVEDVTSEAETTETETETETTEIEIEIETETTETEIIAVAIVIATGIGTETEAEAGMETNLVVTIMSGRSARKNEMHVADRVLRLRVLVLTIEGERRHVALLFPRLVFLKANDALQYFSFPLLLHSVPRRIQRHCCVKDQLHFIYCYLQSDTSIVWLRASCF